MIKVVQMMLVVLPILMLIDVATAWLAAFINEELSSKVNARGFGRKLMSVLFVLSMMTVDLVAHYLSTHLNINTQILGFDTGTLALFTFLSLSWVLIGELISIYENLNKGQMSLPEPFVELVERVRQLLNGNK